MTGAHVREGYVDFRGHRTWYRVIGEPSHDAARPPLLCVHGGPGLPWPDDLGVVAPFIEAGRPVVQYHQSGCGHSDRPGDPARYDLAVFVEELAVVRHQVGLERVHLLGHSFGGMVVLEYLLTRPDGVLSAVLTDSLASVPCFAQEAGRLVDELPPDVRDLLRRCAPRGPVRAPRRARARSGTSAASLERRARVLQRAYRLLTRPGALRIAQTVSRVPGGKQFAYQVAALQYARRHLCRVDPMPLAVFEAFAGSNRVIYETMWGPDETRPTGTLRDWDVTDRLPEVATPVLVTSGRFDETTPASTREMVDRLPVCEWLLFEESSHMPMLEEPEAWHDAVLAFLAAHDAGGPAEAR